MKKPFYLVIFLFLLTNLCFKCTCKDDGESGICYEFDQRQCAGDEWAEIVPQNEIKEQREKKMEAYLESKNIAIKEVLLVEGFHEAVCEACFICPEEDRFFIRLTKEDLSKLQELDLLNLAEIDCADVF